jgi:prepilin-type N-terminal cleavage/methylation domain-containing protein
MLNNQKGTTLIELMVSVAIFSVLILMITSIFKAVIDGQRSSLAAQNTQESMRFVMETMSKSIRQAQKGESYCQLSGGAVAVNKVYNTDGVIATVAGVSVGSEILYFKNKYGNCFYYFLGNDNRLYMASSTPTIPAIEVFPITPDEVQVSGLDFTIVDDAIGAFHSVQPRVTFKMKVEFVGRPEYKQTVYLQTTVSSRHYE